MTGEVFTSVVDFGAGGEVLNVELIFFSAILQRVDSLVAGVFPGTPQDGALLYRFGDPIAQIKCGRTGIRQTGHMTGAARILVDSDGNACGVSVFDLRDEGGSALALTKLHYELRTIS